MGGGGGGAFPPTPGKMFLKKLHGKYKMNKITNISKQFIQLEQITTLGTGIVNILFCYLQ